MRILLEGRPGSGKSTVARRLADRLGEDGIPVTGFIT
jgi:nucleoside-triphosphatase THEP1